MNVSVPTNKLFPWMFWEYWQDSAYRMIGLSVIHTLNRCLPIMGLSIRRRRELLLLMMSTIGKNIRKAVEPAL